MRFTQAHIDEVLDAYPRLHRRPSRDSRVALLQGKLGFVMSAPGWLELSEAFEAGSRYRYVHTPAFLAALRREGGSPATQTMM